MLKIYKKYTLSKLVHKRINKIKIRHTHKHALIGGSRDDPNFNLAKKQIPNPNNDQQTRINLQQTYNTLLNKILVSLIPPIQNRRSVAKNIFDTPITITNEMFPKNIILYAFIILYTFIKLYFKIDIALNNNNINILKSIIDLDACNESRFTQELKNEINTFIVQYIYVQISTLDINDNLSDNIVDNIKHYNTLRDYLGCFFNSDKQLVSSVNVFQYFIITYKADGSSKIDTIKIFNSPLIAAKEKTDNEIKQPNDIKSINTSNPIMFFEPQQGAGCGRHALNNILGGTYFIAKNTSDDDKTIKDNYDKMQPNTLKLSTGTPFNLITYCKYLKIKTLGNSTTEYVEVINKKSITHKNGSPNCDYTSENYDITLLISAMQLFGYNISPYNDKELYNIVSPTFIGFIVGTGGHWYVHKKIDKRNAHDHPLFVHIDSKIPDPNRKTRTFNEILEYALTSSLKHTIYTVINTQPRKKLKL